MADWYTGKVLCPDCKGECVVHYDHVNYLGETVDWPEQCWTCGGSGYVGEKWLREHQAREADSGGAS